MRRLLIAVVALAAAPAGADAATVSVPNPDAVGIQVRIIAAPGETNHVTVQVADKSGSAMTITDSGAPLTATGSPCTNVDEHTVTCSDDKQGTGFVLTHVELGDGDDSYSGGTRFSSDDVFAGSGDDTVDAGPGFDDIDGGGGRDTLTGETIVDGDATTTVDRDVLSGVEIDYSARTADLVVDLHDHTGGEAGEGDVLRGFYNAVGGAGNDQIVGNTKVNHLVGNDGDDVLTGRGGNDHNDRGDHLEGDAGDDWLRGAGGAESFDGASGNDRYRCRGGDDIVFHPELGELLGGACERATFPVGEEDSHVITPNPVRFDGATATFVGTCPYLEELEGEPPTCGAKLVLRHATGSQGVLGRGRYTLDERDDIKYTVRLTRKGRALARRRKGVVVNATLQGNGVPKLEFTIKLKTR